MNEETKTVLVIDDQVEIRDLVDISLRGTEFRVIQASGGKEGIIAARDASPDIILLDIMMPKFDGFMTCKILKRNPGTKDIPVIFLSAKKTKLDINNAIKVGGSDYLMKPFDTSDLLTRLRRVSATKNAKKNKPENETQEKANTKTKALKEYLTFQRHNDVVVFTSKIGNMVLENCNVYRDAFTTIITDGVYKIVFDLEKLEHIDGSGLALLISVNEAVKPYGGGLHITYPQKSVNNRFSLFQPSDLFRSYATVGKAIESFNKTHDSLDIDIDEEYNLCLACTYVNTVEARYCAFCGTNLVLGKADKILEVLERTIVRKLLADAESTDIHAINASRNIAPDEYEVPKELSVELSSEGTVISYQSQPVDLRYFKSHEIIGITAPTINNYKLPVSEDLNVVVSNPFLGSISNYETKIKKVVNQRGILYVSYTKDAMILHSQRQFSVAPKNPIPIRLIIPGLGTSCQVIKAKILEVSRTRLIVFSENEIPTDICMTISFYLPDELEISTPFVICQKGRRNYMYEIEFKIIDEKESTYITQYMYRRQIELAKSYV